MAKPWVLVVEDNDVTRALAEDRLGVAGYAVVACPSGEEGIAWLATGRPNLILMDFTLPGQDGLAPTRRLVELPADRSGPRAPGWARGAPSRCPCPPTADRPAPPSPRPACLPRRRGPAAPTAKPVRHRVIGARNEA